MAAPLFGWSTDSAFNAFIAQCGVPKYHRTYDQATLPATWSASAASADAAAGVILSHWSWKAVCTLFGNSACFIGALTNKQQTTTTAVLTTSVAHGLNVSDTVAVINSGSASIDGTWVVTAKTTTTFTVTVSVSTTVTSQACNGIAVGGPYNQNARFATFLASIPAQSGARQYIVTGWHEPGSEFKSGAFTPAQWRDTQVRCGLITQAVAATFGRTDLHYAIVTEGGYAMTDHYGDADTTYWDSRMDTAIDYIFHDNYVDLKGNVSYNESVHANVDPCTAFNARHGNKPYGIGELGICEADGSGQPGLTKLNQLQLINSMAQAQNWIGVSYFSGSTGSHSVADPSFLLPSTNPATGNQDSLAYWKTLETGSAFVASCFDSVPISAPTAVVSTFLHVNVVTASESLPLSDQLNSAAPPIVINVPIALGNGSAPLPTEVLGSPFNFGAPLATGFASALDLVATVGTAVFAFAPDVLGVTARGLDLSVIIGPIGVLGDFFGSPILMPGLTGFGSCDLQGSGLEPNEATSLVPAQFPSVGAHSIWLRYTAASAGVLTFAATLLQAGYRVAAFSGAAVDDPLLTLIVTATSDGINAPVLSLAVNNAETVYIYVGSIVDTTPFSTVGFSWAYAPNVLAPQLQLAPVIMDSVPTSVVVSVLNMGTAGELVDFSVVGNPAILATLQAQPGGTIVGASVPIGIPLPNGSYQLQAVGRQTGSTATAQFTLLRDPATRPSAPPADVPPIVPAQVGVQRWVLQDPTPGGLGTFIFPINPKTSSNPFASPQLTIEHTVAPDGTAVVWEGAFQPVQMNFSGYADSPTFHSQMQAFQALNAKFYLIDHFGRVWTVTMTDFGPDRRVTQPSHSSAKPWAANYTASVLIFAGPM